MRAEKKKLLDAVVASGFGYLAYRKLSCAQMRKKCADELECEVQYAILSGDADRIARTKEARHAYETTVSSV